VPRPAFIEVAQGPVNGVNCDFYTSAPYIQGSTEVFLNGQAKRKDWEDGWMEMGARRVRLKQAPQTGDVVEVYYRPA
jgi:hypothetical protein